MTWHGRSRVGVLCMKAELSARKGDTWKGGFWNKPEFIEAQKNAKSPVRMPTIAEAQDTGDKYNKGAFWKRPDWQAKQATAAKENNGKYMAGSGLWDEGTPDAGVYYKVGDQLGGVSKRAGVD